MRGHCMAKALGFVLAAALFAAGPMFAGEPEAQVLAAVNKAIDELRADGTLKKLSDKYFNADVTQ